MTSIKRNENVLSVSTVVAVVFSTLVMIAMSVILMASESYAVEIGDEFGGPGIGMADSTWSGGEGSRIYGYGNVNGIVGDVVDEHNAQSSAGPQKYIIYNDNNPVDPATLGGPTTIDNSQYSLHYINDGGPGMGVQTNELGQPQYYNDGGPGMALIQQQQAQYQLDNAGPTVGVYSAGPSTSIYSPGGVVYGQTGTEYVDLGPVGYDKVVNPSDYVKLLNMKPGDFKFQGGSLEDKTR